MEGTHPVGRQPFMPDSTLSRRSVALHARLAKYPSGNHKIIPRIVLFTTFSFLNKFSQIIVPASLRTETNRSIYMRYRLRFRPRCRPHASTVVATHRGDSLLRPPLQRWPLFPH